MISSYTDFLKVRGNKIKELVLILFVSVIFLAVLSLTTTKLDYSNPFFAANWDHHKYIEMAKHPFTFHIAPYCWRIFVPLVSFLLPFDLEINFLVITCLCLLFTSVLIYYLLKEFNFEGKFAFLGILIYFTLGWATKYFIYDFWLVDPMTILLAVAILYTIVKELDYAFSFLLVIGVLTKETILFVAPLFYSMKVKQFWDSKLFLRFLTFVFPAICVFIFIRIIISAYNNNPSYLATLPEQLKVVYNNQSDYNLSIYFNIDQSWYFMLENIGGTLGIILLLFPFFNWKKNVYLFKKFSPFILLCFIQILSPINVPRLLIICFPVFIIMAVFGIKKFIQNKNYKYYSFVTLLIVFFILNISNSHLPSLQFRYEILIMFLYFLSFSIIKIVRTKNENSFLRKA
jgi:hypothetical protein